MPAPRRATEERLHEVVVLGKRPHPPSALELRPYLGDRSGMVVAVAAKLAGEHALADLQAELEGAFSRLSHDPVRTDPGCRAKLAIAEALRMLGSHSFDVFLRGVVLKQPEPAYGRPLDTAAPLRVCCATALLEARHSLAWLHAAPLLADPEPTARAGIAAVLGQIGGDTGEALLRLKVLTGDSEPGVTGACLQGLLTVSIDRELAFVLEAMKSSGEDVVRLGLLGLGESRDARTLPVLFEYATIAVDDDVRTTALLALALSRLPEARAFLDAIVETGSESRAKEAREALDAVRGTGR